VDIFALLFKTILLRPYVFMFLAAFLFSASRLLGWRRTGVFFLLTWITAFICEFSSTRTGIPFGWYHYTGSTVGRELYVSNVPFMDSLSFTFLLYASYCLSLIFLLPVRPHKMPSAFGLTLLFDLGIRTSWPALGLTALFFAFIDVVIDPVALRGDRWFLGRIYYYPEPGTHFGVPVANYVGWAVVGLIALTLYFAMDRRLPSLPIRPDEPVTGKVLLGCSLYYGVLLFNLAMTFWIDEPLLGMTGILIYIPITALLMLRLSGRLPAASR
jgi:uncharacterized membrane protein